MNLKRVSISLILILALVSGAAWAADVEPRVADTTQVPEDVKRGQGQPDKEVQFVYSLSPWTGNEYGGTFAPRQVSTIYMMADATNIINSLRSEVYYWDITREYMADWFGYKEEVPGTLEILQGGRVVQALEKTSYVYSYPDGYDGKVQLVLGAEAALEFDRYNQVTNDYWDAVTVYYEEQAAWQATMDKLLQRVQKTGVYAKPEEIPPTPVQPTPPVLYVTEPVQAFVFNLPAGNYKVRVKAPDGTIVANSEKNLVLFESRRQGVGFQIIPESKWTQPVMSNDQSQVLYLEGKRVFYLKPFFEEEYNQYSYVKMASLHKPLEGLGTKSAWAWVHTDEITQAHAEILKDGKVVQTIERKPYYVEQTAGYALGYKVVEWQADPNFPESLPTFEAFKIELDAKGLYQIRFVDGEGNVIPGSERDIRSVNATTWPLYVLPLLPLLVGFAIFFWRRSLKVEQVEGFDPEENKPNVKPEGSNPVAQ